MTLKEKRAIAYVFSRTNSDAGFPLMEESYQAGWDAALNWAAENGRLKAVDDHTGLIVERDIKTVQLMDETYQIDPDSILVGETLLASTTHDDQTTH